ncbi:MAG: FKBP-type peptidyl-prolyl cis-trans isomerase [Prevotella sp.]|nr:FKBP-type peptidyl-prolyl cis-trans isomerase [Prevotella sp.]MCM1436441.1 FKBP-type peptidyl-prolyl cis-trans isomerase [Prevotella sp.]
MAKETIDTGKFVAFSYKVNDAKNGETLFEASKDAPDTLIYGVTPGVIPGLAAALKGLGKGDKFSSELPPAAAFGDRLEENVLTLDKTVFNPDGKLPSEVKVGAHLPMLTEDGYQVVGTVLEVGDKVKMDFNHPFAGKTVKIEGEIEDVRDATPEELNPSHGCGCGCGHDHGDCGDGCGDDHCGGCCH